jgi:hypothetical protein
VSGRSRTACDHLSIIAEMGEPARSSKEPEWNETDGRNVQ